MFGVNRPFYKCSHSLVPKPEYFFKSSVGKIAAETFLNDVYATRYVLLSPMCGEQLFVLMMITHIWVFHEDLKDSVRLLLIAMGLCSSHSD